MVLIYSQTEKCWCTISVFRVGTRDSERGHKGYTVVERTCLSSGLHLGMLPFLSYAVVVTGTMVLRDEHPPCFLSSVPHDPSKP